MIPQVQDTPQSIQDPQPDESEGEVAAVPLLVDHGVSGGESDRPLLDTESLSSHGVFNRHRWSVGSQRCR